MRATANFAPSFTAFFVCSWRFVAALAVLEAAVGNFNRVVFTGKTIGKQIAFTLKPFVFKWLNSLKDNKMTGKFMKAVGGLTPDAVSKAAESEWCCKAAPVSLVELQTLAPYVLKVHAFLQRWA